MADSGRFAADDGPSRDEHQKRTGKVSLAADEQLDRVADDEGASQDRGGGIEARVAPHGAQISGRAPGTVDKQRGKYQAEYAKLEAEYENADELPDDVDARLGEIETALATPQLLLIYHINPGAM